LELLWKYYEKSHNYLEAAKVLAGMASKTTRFFLGIFENFLFFFNF